MNFKNTIIIILLVSLLGSSIAAAYYSSENTKSKTALSILQTEEAIERNKETYESNEKKEIALKDRLQRQDTELKNIYKKYNDLKRKKVPTKSTIRKEFKNVKNNKDICKEFANINYPICASIIPSKCSK